MHDPIHAARETRLGVTYGLLAYLWWGMVAIYFAAIKTVPPLEVLAHRVVWSLLLLGVLLAWRRQWMKNLRALRDRRTLLLLLGSTSVIACNWFVFIYSVANDRLVEASLGYFINPLVNILLGFIFLRERLRRLQTVSVLLAATGVIWLTWSLGVPPWIALILGFSFGFYGLLRKVTSVDSLGGLTLETMLLGPLALGYLLWLGLRGEGTFLGGSLTTDGLLIFAGVVTALPLLWFAAAARRLRLMTVGFLQYLAPTCQFFLAVFYFREPFTTDHLVAFGFIWAALALYTIDAVTRYRSGRRAASMRAAPVATPGAPVPAAPPYRK